MRHWSLVIGRWLFVCHHSIHWSFVICRRGLVAGEKGYSLSKASNGQEAIELCKENTFDLILLDQSMPGMDGLETLAAIKKDRSSQLIIMITKTEDEWLMDEAMTEQVQQFLIKPVNPSQIFMACKKALEEDKLLEQKATSEYLKEFQEIDQLMNEQLDADDWWKLYDRLVNWQLKFDIYRLVFFKKK